MAFGTIEFTTISRAQDYTTIKQNEDNKPMLDQSHLSVRAERTVEELAKTVTDSSEADWHNKKHDARDKGSNEYAGDGGKNRKKKEEKDRVIVKGGGFDMKV